MLDNASSRVINKMVPDQLRKMALRNRTHTLSWYDGAPFGA